LRFQVGDFVYLKVSPMKGLHRFKIRGKLAPRYIRPFKILEQRGEVAYQLELPPQLSDVHDVFHVSLLRKCLWVPEEQMPLEELTVGEDLTYQEYPVKILDTSDKVTWNNRYKMCKVQWSNHTEEEATWEKEYQLKVEFPEIFSNLSESRGRDSSEGGQVCNTLKFWNFEVNAFHLNSNMKFSNKLIGLHFMACIFLFLSPRSISIFWKDLNIVSKSFS
jgi:hypothetical protein